MMKGATWESETTMKDGEKVAAQTHETAKPKIYARRKKRERKNMATLPLTEVVAAMSKTEKKVNISSHCDITH